MKYISNNPNNIEVLFDLFDVLLNIPSRASSPAPAFKSLIRNLPLQANQLTEKNVTTCRHPEETLNTRLAILQPSDEVGPVPQSLPDHTDLACINFIVERGMLGVGRAPTT